MSSFNRLWSIVERKCLCWRKWGLESCRGVSWEFLLWCSCRFHLITYIIINVYVVIFIACLSTLRLSFLLSFIWCLFFRGLIVHSLINVFRMSFEQFCTAYNMCYLIPLVKFSSIWTYSYYILLFYIIAIVIKL